MRLRTTIITVFITVLAVMAALKPNTVYRFMDNPQFWIFLAVLLFIFYVLPLLLKPLIPQPSADYYTKSDPPPPAGARIRLTWLPYNNAYPEPNCYIGSEGIVTQLDVNNGSFVLDMGGASLIIGNTGGRHGNGYTYELLEKAK